MGGDGGRLESGDELRARAGAPNARVRTDVEAPNARVDGVSVKDGPEVKGAVRAGPGAPNEGTRSTALGWPNVFVPAFMPPEALVPGLPFASVMEGDADALTTRPAPPVPVPSQLEGVACADERAESEDEAGVCGRVRGGDCEVVVVVVWGWGGVSIGEDGKLDRNETRMQHEEKKMRKTEIKRIAGAREGGLYVERGRLGRKSRTKSTTR